MKYRGEHLSQVLQVSLVHAIKLGAGATAQETLVSEPLLITHYLLPGTLII